jgi:hypothetical protein
VDREGRVCEGDGLHVAVGISVPLSRLADKADFACAGNLTVERELFQRIFRIEEVGFRIFFQPARSDLGEPLADRALVVPNAFRDTEFIVEAAAADRRIP